VRGGINFITSHLPASSTSQPTKLSNEGNKIYATTPTCQAVTKVLQVFSNHFFYQVNNVSYKPSSMHHVDGKQKGYSINSI
jgi:hypothetical protein